MTRNYWANSLVGLLFISLINAQIPPGLLQLNLSENGLRFLPADITKLQKLEKLLCSNNELADLPHAATLPSLKELDLSFNRLRCAIVSACSCWRATASAFAQHPFRHVPQEIHEFTHLRVLRLASNMIVELPPLRLPKLVSLSLANNALPLLPAASLSLLTSLTNLNVERNQFNFWPLPEGLVLSNLQSFNCSYNGIYVLPANFEETFLQLTELRIAAANLDGLPASLSRLTKLTSLDVSSNALRTLAHVTSLSNLEKLQVNANRLASLDGVGALASLNRLEAASNKITALPADMTSLRSLECLHLGSNELTALPDGLFGVTLRLTELVLSRNELTCLPDEISRLKQLEILDVYDIWN